MQSAIDFDIICGRFYEDLTSVQERRQLELIKTKSKTAITIKKLGDIFGKKQKQKQNEKNERTQMKTFSSNQKLSWTGWWSDD